jgi:hypothetical protein
MTSSIKEKARLALEGEWDELERVGVVTSHGTIVMILVSFGPWGDYVVIYVEYD